MTKERTGRLQKGLVGVCPHCNKPLSIKKDTKGMYIEGTLSKNEEEVEEVEEEEDYF